MSLGVVQHPRLDLGGLAAVRCDLGDGRFELELRGVEWNAPGQDGRAFLRIRLTFERVFYVRWSSSHPVFLSDQNECERIEELEASPLKEAIMELSPGRWALKTDFGTQLIPPGESGRVSVHHYRVVSSSMSFEFLSTSEPLEHVTPDLRVDAESEQADRDPFGPPGPNWGPDRPPPWDRAPS
jgi:hypothetical protein